MHHTTGSHHLLKHPDTPHLRVTLPLHHRDLKRRTLESIIEPAGLTVEAFQQLLSTHAGISAPGREVQGSAGVEIKPVLNHIGRYRVSRGKRGKRAKGKIRPRACCPGLFG
jgi:hypothetical protein